LGRAFDGHLAGHHQFLCAQPTSTLKIEARLAPFVSTTILDTRILIAEDLGAAPNPGARAGGVLNQHKPTPKMGW
jgi:hypothetical protein